MSHDLPSRTFEEFQTVESIGPPEFERTSIQRVPEEVAPQDKAGSSKMSIPSLVPNLGKRPMYKGGVQGAIQSLCSWMSKEHIQGAIKEEPDMLSMLQQPLM